MRIAAVLTWVAVGAAPTPDEIGQTWVEIDGITYGARADETGPIGGGEGYTQVITGGDYTAKTLEELIDALKQAQPGQVVFIPGETEIDLTTFIYIDEFVLEVPAGVTLAGNRGQDGSQGAILTSDALKTPVMIRALGPNVRVSGLRVQGPSPKRYIDHHNRAFGKGGEGHTYYYKFPTSSGILTKHDNLRVDNCDVSGFSHGGVNLNQGVGHRVDHCYIHHCQYQGLGYGVVHSVASSTIEYNLFDWNRHSIAGTGAPGAGYVARHNVELGTSLSHCFDMHGGRDRKDGTNIAGDMIEVYNNTFRAPQTPIVIRGVPQEGCDVYENWFPKHDTPGRAVGASAGTRVFRNAYGVPGTVVD
jgi:hypothetical protein